MSGEIIKRRLGKIEERINPPRNTVYVRVIRRDSVNDKRQIADYPEIEQERRQHEHSIVLIL